MFNLEKLYFESPYIKEFTAEIINVLEKDNKYYIELDKTYFYPGSESIPFDSGFIDAAPVLYIYLENEIIYHVVEVKPIKIHKVKCRINFEKRLDYMQQHLGQHILSATIKELFNSNIINFKIENTSSYIDIDKSIDNSEIKNIEKISNKIVIDNINVETLYPTNSELKKLLNKKIPIRGDEKIALIKIGDKDLSVCNDIHLHSTIEVQIIKIARILKIKTGTRIEFICGSRAISDYLIKHEKIDKINKLLACNPEDMLDKIENLAHELRNANSEIRALKATIVEYKVQNILSSCENINNIRIIKSIYESGNLKEINILASKLISFPNVIALFGIKTQDNTQLLFMKSKDLKIISMNSLLKDAISLIDGKGGGSDYSAQGGGKNNNNLASCIDYAYTKVKDSILNI